MRRIKRRRSEFLTALQQGGAPVRLSCFFMGFGHLRAGQWGKAAGYFLLQLAAGAFFLLPGGGLYRIGMLPSLGSQPQREVWDDALGVYVYTPGDRSQLILLYGIVCIALLFGFFLCWRSSVIGGYRALIARKRGGAFPSLLGEVQMLGDEKVHRSLMFLPAACLFVFTIIPLLYMMSMAFTDFSQVNDKLVLFDWVGLRNFLSVFDPNAAIGRQFWGVLGWTLVWAFLATFLNFILGLLLAMLINRPEIRFPGLFRGVLSVTAAVPQFVSLLVLRSMFQPQGIINRLLPGDYPFLQDAVWARTLVILVNLWVGIPFTVLQVTGVLKNIPGQLYEAARLDGAGAGKVFRHITLPYMLFVMGPYLITQFTANINNFNVIWLFTRGEPIAVGDSAGKTDLLVTWLYKLSVDQQRYNLAAVIGIFTFLILSAVSLLTYRRTAAYKNEEGFR